MKYILEDKKISGLQKTVNDCRGFSLIEVAFVLIIGGILISAAFGVLMVYIKHTNIKSVEEKLARIDEALEMYLSVNGRYPCAAPLAAAPDSAGFGVENSTACSGGAVSGTTRINGFVPAGSSVRLGGVPVRTLNLPDDYITDPWGQRFTYAVTEGLATDGTYQRDGGNIQILDSAGNPVISPSGTAHYVVLSHGINGAGGTSLGGGGIATPCIAGSMEQENCDGDAVFRRTLLSATAANANLFDDFISVRANSLLDAGVPAGAVLPFNLSACPRGWVPFSQGVGRFVVGAGNGFSENYTVSGRSGWSFADNYDLLEQGGFGSWRGVTAESGLNVAATAKSLAGLPNGTERYVTFSSTWTGAADNRPPFVALLYCQKT